jgi:hypothetical protein
MSRYALLFHFPLEEAFSRHFEWSSDEAAIDRARLRLERFIGPGPDRPACSVSVSRLEPAVGRSMVELGVWRFTPRRGFEWTPADRRPLH